MFTSKLKKAALVAIFAVAVFAVPQAYADTVIIHCNGCTIIQK